ncbi:hypothetical protein MVEN_00882600 [Mycena venus]|uniref:Uncharacterized protein n=1 Tax=Mycena venus TaxID=2733690 RepID=A0A8H7D466_9AGAR|nr:hypothetical protein MVEN_00882600 [Mycena venus]
MVSIESGAFSIALYSHVTSTHLSPPDSLSNSNVDAFTPTLEDYYDSNVATSEDYEDDSDDDSEIALKNSSYRAEVIAAICICAAQTMGVAKERPPAVGVACSDACDRYAQSALEQIVKHKIAKIFRRGWDDADQAVSNLVKVIQNNREPNFHDDD